MFKEEGLSETQQTTLQPPPAGREIHTMPEQFVVKPILKDWKGILLLSGIAIVLIGLIAAGTIFLVRSFKQTKKIQTEKEIPPSVETTAAEAPSVAPQPETPKTPEIQGAQEIPPTTPIVEQPVPSEEPEVPKEQVGAFHSAQDSDNDQMTDIEEELLGTDPTKSDTDGDGYKDGEEMIHLYNPRQSKEGQGVKLNDSGLILIFKNPVFGWSIFYPPAWLARPLDETNREVIITAATGEFIQISQQPNPEKLSLLDWYLAQAPGVDSKTLKEVATIAGLKGLWAPDGLTIYLTKPKGDTIYFISYNIGTRTELNFPIVFRMMVESFSLPL